MPKVATGIESPLAPGGGKLISRDGRSALVTFNVAGKPDNADQTAIPAERAVAAIQAAHPGLRVAESGQASVDRATNNIISADFRHAEVTSVPITLVLLLCVFGALIAAGIPLLLAGIAVTSAISLLAIPSRWLPVGSTTSSVVLLVGGHRRGGDRRQVTGERTWRRPGRGAHGAAASTPATLVSVTIGGNDVGFSNVMITCVLGSTSDCVNAVNQAEAQANSQLPGLLDTLYRDISARAPNARVVVIGYPEF